MYRLAINLCAGRDKMRALQENGYSGTGSKLYGKGLA
jgi:hypothetical protein